MRYGLVVLAQVALVAFVVCGTARGWFPLGVPGEWEWSRARHGPNWPEWCLGSAVVAGYAGLAALGARWLGPKAGRRREALCVLALGPLAFFVQLGATQAAPIGYGPAKWAGALSNSGSTGHHAIAARIESLPEFLAGYPEFVKRGDALHVGTHPPGLFVVAWASIDLMRQRPELAKAIARNAPRGFVEAPPTMMAAYVLTGLVTMALCSFTTWPIYLLARRWADARGAWLAATLWPLAPSALMFQPVADTAYPLLSASAFALAAWSSTRRGAWLAGGAGALLAVGMVFSLAFLGVGLIVGLVMLADRARSWRGRAGSWAATGAGFVLTTLALSWAMGAGLWWTWWENQRNHARFYVEYPRSFWPWALENPIELAIGMGVPAFVWAIVGLRKGPAVAWATLGTLALLTLCGRSLSEVGRLWLPFLPGTYAAAALGARGAGPATTAATVAVMGTATLGLQAMIQVVYPA